MGSVKLVVECLFTSVMFIKATKDLITYPLVELAGYRLARHQTTLAHKQPSIRIESGDSEHDLLCTIFEHPCLTLFQEAKEKAYSTGEQTL
jgi:hypothetical protein